MKIRILFLLFSLVSLPSYAARGRASTPTFVYDLGVSGGTYDNEDYTEVNLGLSWYAMEHLAWRNSVFGRFTTTNIFGLDSSLRFVFNAPRDEDGFGLGAFAGPGYRFSDKENSGVFGEAGVLLKLAGFATGVGAKSIYYNSPGTNSDGLERPRSDTIVFLILGFGGGF
jgi:hypothetical protein